jgi:glycosyltransferase involved in cell wall biosynthesis
VSPEKGLHVLVDAFAQVHSACPNAELSIVGPTPPLPPELLAVLSRDPKVSALSRFYPDDYVAQLTRRVPPDVAAGVSFVGPVAHGDTVRYYRAADVYVMPSLSEAFGMAAVEAMAVGLPVVASRVEGIPETVCDEVTGLLVAPDDSGALAQALLRLLGDERLRRAMGEAGRRRAVQRFSWERIVQTLGDHYQRLGGGDARPRG